MKKHLTVLILVVTSLFILNGCKGNTDEQVANDISENSQQIGDVMSSVDEFGGTTGTIAYMRAAEKMFARLAPEEVMTNKSFVQNLVPYFMRDANAASCSTIGFSGCVSNARTRNFGNCSIQSSLVISGDVTLTWGGSAVACQISGMGQTITRDPNFTIEGRLGYTLEVKKSGAIGQRLTSQGGAVYNMVSDGIRRTFKNAGNTAVLDYTTSTGSALTVTSTSRAGRTISGGSIVVVDNLKGITCTYTPSAVSWAADCNCPKSGNWQVTCRDGSNAITSTFNLTHSAGFCGVATYSDGNVSGTLTFDRCGS